VGCQKKCVRAPPLIWGAMYQEDGVPNPPLHNANKSDVKKNVRAPLNLGRNVPRGRGA
jgi:hypothetical protein